MDSSSKKIFPLSTALRSAAANYSMNTFKHDLMAGFIVSLIALPLSMALSIAVGLPPQHGLYTAIVAGIAGAIFGGSMTQVSGPTAAFVVIIAPIVTRLGLEGLIACQLIAGCLLIVMGLARLGRFIHRIPHAVVVGFTTGIAMTIALLALNDFFGLGIKDLHGHFLEKAKVLLEHKGHFKLSSFFIGFISLATLFLFPKVTTRLPSPIVAVTLGALTGWLLSKNGVPIETLESRFSFSGLDGAMHGGVPPYPPAFSWPDFSYLIQNIDTLIAPALLIAILAGLESLLSARVADKMAHTHHNPDSELNGIGIANICSALYAGIPATGAIARTATNIHSGARTPLASVIHALFVFLYMVSLAPLISHIPMSVLSALLLATAYRMSHLHEFMAILKSSERTEIIVLLACFLVTVLVDMVAGVASGLALSLLLFLIYKKPRINI